MSRQAFRSLSRCFSQLIAEHRKLLGYVTSHEAAMRRST